MTMGAHVPWSNEQREWLQALGHDVLALASPGSEAPAAAPRNEVAVEPPRNTRGPTPAPVSPLLRALARAARRSEDDAELLKTVPDLSVLRGNPAARRALWPRLRALRRRTPQ